VKTFRRRDLAARRALLTKNRVRRTAAAGRAQSSFRRRTPGVSYGEHSPAGAHAGDRNATNALACAVACRLDPAESTGRSEVSASATFQGRRRCGQNQLEFGPMQVRAELIADVRDRLATLAGCG
jgi:hypothetical protein